MSGATEWDAVQAAVRFVNEATEYELVWFRTEVVAARLRALGVGDTEWFCDPETKAHGQELVEARRIAARCVLRFLVDGIGALTCNEEEMGAVLDEVADQFNAAVGDDEVAQRLLRTLARLGGTIAGACIKRGA